MLLRILLVTSRIPLHQVNKVAVFTCMLLQKGLMGNELLIFYEIITTYQKFLDKQRKIIIVLNGTKTKLIIISILKDTSDIIKVLGVKGSGTPNALSINQYCSTSIYTIIHSIDLQLQYLQMINSLLQIIVKFIEKCFHGGNIDLWYGCCQRHHCQYLLNTIILQSTTQVHSWPHQVVSRNPEESGTDLEEYPNSYIGCEGPTGIIFTTSHYWSYTHGIYYYIIWWVLVSLLIYLWY